MKHKPGHVLAFWGRLKTAQKKNFLTQMQQWDLSEIPHWIRVVRKPSRRKRIGGRLTPAQSYSPIPTNARQKRKYSKAIELGKKLIRQGKVAAFVVAGGQGTRLEFDGPKGNFPISPVKKKTLFQIFAETIAAVSRKYHTVCPWYIMASPLNYEQIRDIFRSNDYYGLGEENVFIFQQGTLPNFSFHRNIFLAAKDRVACSPDGHGGSLKALYKSGALDDMKRRGVEFISYWQVDNPLVKIFDPLFIGLHALDKAQMSSKAVIKTGPFEKVGNFCLRNGKVTVVEYSDLPGEMAVEQDHDGSFRFRLGSIAIHIIKRSFFEKLNVKGICLPLHRAAKEITHIDRYGRRVKPSRKNGVKLERFIFDALPLASKSIILQTLRSTEFAPVKNATGIDSVETARQMMVARAADWLESVGVSVPRKPDGQPDATIEISPAFALQREDLKARLKQIPRIKPGATVYLD